MTEQEASDNRERRRGKAAGLDKKDEVMHDMLGASKEQEHITPQKENEISSGFIDNIEPKMIHMFVYMTYLCLSLFQTLSHLNSFDNIFYACCAGGHPSFLHSATWRAAKLMRWEQ
jgi:hypothetical protein